MQQIGPYGPDPRSKKKIQRLPVRLDEWSGQIGDMENEDYSVVWKLEGYGDDEELRTCAG
jgi:hypothetical protein